MTSAVDQLIELANTFGADQGYSRAGGGNASVKVDGVLWIKPSGVPLATLAADDLVGLRVDVLLDALASDAPVEGDPVLVAAARALVEAPNGRRPSVEILFHALMPQTLVVHTHPLVVNALTCNADDEALVERLLGDRALLVPYVDPGVPLARRVAAERSAYASRTGRPAPAITLLANHGLIVAGEAADEVVASSRWLAETLRVAIAGGDASVANGTPATGEAAAFAAEFGRCVGAAEVAVSSDPDALAITLTAAGRVLMTEGPLIPDQIVYAGSLPCVLMGGPVEADVAHFVADQGKCPIIAVAPGVAIMAAGASKREAETALCTFTDALAMARDANRIGRVRPMTLAQRTFIETWEAEAYRRSVASVL